MADLRQDRGARRLMILDHEESPGVGNHSGLDLVVHSSR